MRRLGFEWAAFPGRSGTRNWKWLDSFTKGTDGISKSLEGLNWRIRNGKAQASLSQQYLLLLLVARSPGLLLLPQVSMMQAK